MSESGVRLEVADFTQRFHRHFSRDANRCLTLGVDEKAGELPDPSLAEQGARRAEAEELLARMPLADPEHDFDGSLDLDLARLTLRAELDSDALVYNGLLHS